MGDIEEEDLKNVQVPARGRFRVNTVATTARSTSLANAPVLPIIPPSRCCIQFVLSRMIHP
jgi:hypothetical protein